MSIHDKSLLSPDEVSLKAELAKIDREPVQKVQELENGDLQYLRKPDYYGGTADQKADRLVKSIPEEEEADLYPMDRKNDLALSRFEI